MKKVRIYILASLMTAGLSSCDLFSDFGDINDNPAATTTPIPAALMTNVQSGIGGYAYMITPGYFCQYFAESQYSSASLYATPQSDFTGTYSGSLYDLQNIINMDDSKSMSAVATILQQYIFWTITDRWGDVPYSEALQGASYARPKYDTQEEIYKGMIAKLKEANAMFDGSLIRGDLIYNGDAAKWKKAANTMRMLMALQLSNRYPNSGDYAATEFNAALNDPAGIITSNADNFQLTYPGGNFPSPYWTIYNGRRDVGESDTMTELMKSLGDGRQEAYGGVTDEYGIPNTSVSSNVGLPYGVVRATAEAFTSANPGWARVLRGDLRQSNSTVFIITASQAFLARAEAANLGWTNDNLNTVYRTGIQLNFEQWGLNTPANAYFNQAAVAIGEAGAAENKKNIAIQRYIASYPDGLQGWNIWRKTGYPELVPAKDATNASKQIPHRYIYGAGEYTSNKESVEAAVARVGGSYDQDAKVWWE
jgi:hypothetical protein